MCLQVTFLLNNDSKFTVYHNALIAADNVHFRDANIYNSIYILGRLVIISFSVIVDSNFISGQSVATLPDFLKDKIEWNNLHASMLFNRSCPFAFSDNHNDVIIRTDGVTVADTEEIRIWGIGVIK